jgi:hypothetical protein
MSNSLCWICGEPATTGEHKTKQSDLRAVLGTPTPGNPFTTTTGRQKTGRFEAIGQTF